MGSLRPRRLSRPAKARTGGGKQKPETTISAVANIIIIIIMIGGLADEQQVGDPLRCRSDHYIGPAPPPRRPASLSLATHFAIHFGPTRILSHCFQYNVSSPAGRPTVSGALGANRLLDQRQLVAPDSSFRRPTSRLSDHGPSASCSAPPLESIPQRPLSLRLFGPSPSQPRQLPPTGPRGRVKSEQQTTTRQAAPQDGPQQLLNR